MIPLNTILSATESASKLPEVAVGFGALILLLAFFIGFAKGFKWVNWDWFTCLFGFASYVLVDGLLKKNNLKLGFPTIKDISGDTIDTFVIAFGCLAISLVMFGICSALFRPKEVWVRKDRFLFKRDQKAGRGDGNPKRLVYKNYAPPKFIGRLLGGVICMANVGVILALMGSFILFFISATSASGLKIGLVLQTEMGKLALGYAKRYALDFITLCIPFFLACYGFKCGFVKSLRTVFVNAGAILTFGISFWLPFSPLVGKGRLNILGKLISRCTAILNNIPEKLKPFVAKLIAAIFLLVIFFFIFLWIIHLLKKYEEMLEKVKCMQVIDSMVSCILYFIIGIGVCIALWSILYTFDLYQIFKISEVLGEDSMLAKGLFEFAKLFIDSLLKPVAVG